MKKYLLIIVCFSLFVCSMVDAQGVGETRKILHLVPDAIFKNSLDNEDGVIVEKWLDPRPQPTQAEIAAVTDQEVIDSELDIETSRVVGVSKRDRLLFEINFNQENRVRSLEGLSLITRAQYKTAIKKLYKTL